MNDYNEALKQDLEVIRELDIFLAKQGITRHERRSFFKCIKTMQDAGFSSTQDAATQKGVVYSMSTAFKKLTTLILQNKG